MDSCSGCRELHSLSHKEFMCVCPGTKGVHGVKHSAAFWKLLSPTLVLKSSPINLETEIGDIYFKHFFLLVKLESYLHLTLLSMCAQTWCSSLFVRLVGWLFLSLFFPRHSLPLSSLDWLPPLTCKHPGVRMRYFDHQESVSVP